MKTIDVVDEDGFKQRYQIQDDDNPSDAAEVGLNIGAPDTRRINWDEVARELHNKLHDMGLFTMQDVINQQSGLTGAIVATLKKKVKSLYKE